VGIHAPVDVVPWAVYTVLLYLVDVAFCALHIWLAAQVENQLVSVGIGMLGAFLAVFSLLMPSAISKIIPWGYYAVISHARQDNGDITYMTAPYGWVIGFLVLVAVVFLAATRRLNRVER
jgi:putative membrane protein